MKPPKKLTLPNGLRVVFVPQPSSLAASVIILVEAGSEYETKPVNGVSHFLEHLMFKGTARRPKAGMIAEEFASLGAQTNAFTGQEYTGYWAKAEARKLPKILELVSDLYLNPIFDPDEIEKERGVIVEEINMYEDTPASRVHEIFNSLLYGDQPAGWDVSGEKEVIRKLAKDDFLEYRNARYVAPGTVVIVAGKFDEKRTLAAIREYFGGLARRKAGAKPKTKEQQSAPQARVKFKESGQSHLVLGFRAFDLFDRRRHALHVLADVLGGGMSSRLFRRVREELGAAYYIDADADLSLDHGTLAISAGVDHGKIDVVIKAILAECRRLRDELVPGAELQRMKDHMVGGIVLGLETSDALASYYGSQEILAKKLLPPEKLVDTIRRISAAEVRNVARAVFADRRLNLAVIGPYRNAEMFEKILTLHPPISNL
ncbi:MAG TPA: pitrilysin family protein [Candidatus Paceibacterota bacterium]|nr:pitrilysin family protein [Candidatus Paceibacterota bacterium]